MIHPMVDMDHMRFQNTYKDLKLLEPLEVNEIAMRFQNTYKDLKLDKNIENDAEGKELLEYL